MCVLVTGASRGIGRATALAFARTGRDVAINCDKDADGLRETEALIRVFGVRVLPVLADVSDYEAVCGMFDKAEAGLGEVDVLVNNAAIASYGLFGDTDPTGWRRVLDVNLISVLNCCHRAIPGMIRRKSGAIVNISSVWGVKGASCEAVYSASKGAVNAFTRALGRELAPSGVRVNAIAAGVIDTAMNGGLSRGERQALADAIPAGRFGLPEEVAELAVFLAAESAAYITAQVIAVDGGFI